jgi:hypothetical protein
LVWADVVRAQDVFVATALSIDIRERIVRAYRASVSGGSETEIAEQFCVLCTTTFTTAKKVFAVAMREQVIQHFRHQSPWCAQAWESFTVTAGTMSLKR